MFKVLADRENVDIGKPTEIKGLVSYLVQIEKEKVAMKEVSTTTRILSRFSEAGRKCASFPLKTLKVFQIYIGV